jgi:hypothetical protein
VYYKEIAIKKSGNPDEHESPFASGDGTVRPLTDRDESRAATPR